MGTFTVGRIGLEAPSSGEVSGWSESGNRVQVSGYTTYGSVEESLVVRAQFAGYVDSPDESFVPVTWSEQPEVDGFYRVRGVRFDSNPDRAPFGVLDWQLELERVQGFSAPLIELGTLGKVRAGSHGVTFPTQAICVPAAAKSVGLSSAGTFTPFLPSRTRVGESASVLVYDMNPNFKWTTQYYVTPDRFYDGAATLTMGDLSSVVVGRQVQSTPDAWMLSNDLFQIQGWSAAGFGMRMRMWLSGSWTSWVDMELRETTGVILGAPHAITVLENSPDEVRVRLLTATTPAGAKAYSPVTVDVSLKRGSRYASIVLESSFVSTFRMFAASFSAATNDEPWYRWKTIGSTRMVVAAPYTIQQTSTEVYPFEDAVTSVDQWKFMVGLVEGSSADNILQAAYEYLFGCGSEQRVVAQ